MKIESSVVEMASERSYYSYSKKQHASVEVLREDAAKIELSDESKSKLEQLNEYKADMQKAAKEAEKERKEASEKNAAKAMLEASKNQKTAPVEIEEDPDIKLMRKILELLNSLRDGKRHRAVDSAPVKQPVQPTPVQTPVCSNAPVFKGAQGTVGTARVAEWTRITVDSLFELETENTAYRTTGLVKTADGREINFNLTVEMSRAFMHEYEGVVKENYVIGYKDPFVINVSDKFTGMSDKTFMFDIDADGKEEAIPMLSEGAGFLALDKNGDGKINNGSELFGTKTNDGFKELAEYDSDHNGWIDENDRIFSKLKVWMKDEDGNDVLVSLKDADVGAICLQSADTEFSLNDPLTNKQNAVIRKTGVFLKESGGTGTVQHVDFAI